jgi:hypothetical protein
VAQIEKRPGRSALVRHALHRQTDYFRARNPSRIDAKRGDRFLQADSQGTSSVLYGNELKSQLCGLSAEPKLRTS